MSIILTLDLPAENLPLDKEEEEEEDLAAAPLAAIPKAVPPRPVVVVVLPAIAITFACLLFALDAFTRDCAPPFRRNNFVRFASCAF